MSSHIYPFVFTMSAPTPQVEKIVNADAAKFTQSTGSSDDAFLGPPEHKLQRQLKNRHIAMIRFAETLRFCLVDAYQPNNIIVSVVSLEPVRLHNFIRLAL